MSSQSEDVVITHEALVFLINSLPDIKSSTINRRVITQTRREIDALIAAIELYGITPGLLAFADHDGVLSRHIQSFPATESSASGDPNTTELINDLKHLKDMLPKISVAIEGSAWESMLNFWKSLWPKVEHDNEWKTPNPDKLVELLPFSVIVHYVKSMSVMERLAEQMFNFPPANNKSDYEARLKKLNSMFSAMEAEVGIHEDPKTQCIIFDRWPSIKPATLISLGYHETAMHDLGELIVQAWGAWGHMRS